MLAEGAEGETKNALNEYLGTDDFAAYARMYMNVIKSYNTEDENYGYTSKLKIADALWVNQGLTLQDQFQKKAEDNFEAKAEILDFSDKENTCNTINAWCNENTEGLIPEIMKPDMLNENSELCLTNSLYFESGWPTMSSGVPQRPAGVLAQMKVSKGWRLPSGWISRRGAV